MADTDRGPDAQHETSGSPRARATLALAITPIVLLAAIGGVLLDAARRRGDAEPHWRAQEALASATGLTDPFVSSGSRWLRHPSLVEPGAACSDAPDGIDTDPAGMVIAAPPGDVGGAPRLEVRSPERPR